MWAIGEPSGPIENGTTYIVRPRIEPLKSSVSVSRISAGSRQLLVGPASASLLGADEGAVLDAGHVARVRTRQVGARALRVGEPLEGARVHQLGAEAVVFLGRSVAPVHGIRGGQLGHLLDPAEQLRVGRWGPRRRPSSFFRACKHPTLRFGMSATAARPRSPVRAVLRFVASVMIVSGLLLIADAGMTLAWQEPVSAFLADKEQAELKEELDHPPPRVIARRPLPGRCDRRDRAAHDRQVGLHRRGHRHRRSPQGPRPLPRHADARRARHGRRSRATAPPTAPRSATSTSSSAGDRIVLEMPYGSFVYRVEKTQIVEPTALWVTNGWATTGSS